MSQEIQVSRGANGHGNLPTLPPADFRTQGQGYSSSAMPPLKKIHRMLRGRYPLVITLAMVGAITFCIAGWSGMGPRYDAQGLVEIASTTPSVHLIDPQVPGFTMLIEQNVTLLTSPSVIAAAVDNDAFKKTWMAYHHTDSGPSIDEVMQNVDAQRQKVTPDINLHYTDRYPEVAAAGCHAILQTYMDQFGDSDALQREHKIQFNQKLKDQAEAHRNELNEQLQVLSQKYGTSDLTPLLLSNQQELINAQQYLATANEKLKAAKSNQANHVTIHPGDKEKLQEQLIQIIAQRDPEMARLLEARNEVYKRFSDVVQVERYLPNSIQYQLADRDREAAEQNVKDYLDISLPHTSDPDVLRLVGALPDGDVSQLQKDVDTRQKEFDDLMGKSLELNNQKQLIEKVKDEMTQAETRERDLDRTIEDLNVPGAIEAAYGDTQVKVLSWGASPTLANDRRKVLAGAGFLFGGLLPVGAMLLVGLFDRRFRYSDDAEGTPLSDANVLGILPNLPDRLSDPHQAGVAAHCVHQIRTMLQIGRSSDEPQAFCITSAAPGDGKTSLTLALGLSYAACGARTLLIDCDLIGAGLSSRLNIEATEGVLEAVANRVLLQYIRTTDVADVAVLPVGASQSHHASTLSPIGLRRLIAEAKKHFDIVLIDTGPVMGSIEASLVAAAADRTILTYARGQQQPLVEKALAHLKAIGAHMAGVVFNKAQARDFERSYSGMSLRSNRNGKRSAGAYGPVARAVAGTSFKQSSDDE